MWVKEGDIIHTSWGYNMVLHDFYRIEKITDKTCTVQLMKKETVAGDSMMPFVRPTDQPETMHSFGDPQRVKIRTNDRGKHYLWIRNCQLAYLEPWDQNRDYQENHLD